MRTQQLASAGDAFPLAFGGRGRLRVCCSPGPRLHFRSHSFPALLLPRKAGRVPRPGDLVPQAEVPRSLAPLAAAPLAGGGRRRPGASRGPSRTQPATPRVRSRAAHPAPPRPARAQASRARGPASPAPSGARADPGRGHEAELAANNARPAHAPPARAHWPAPDWPDRGAGRGAAALRVRGAGPRGRGRCFVCGGGRAAERRCGSGGRRGGDAGAAAWRS